MKTSTCLLTLCLSLTLGAAPAAAQPVVNSAAAGPALAQPSAFDPGTAKNLADGAVGLAATRLSLNPSDESGLRLLQFAAALNPKNDNLLYLQALINLGRPISPIKTIQVTDAQYVGYLMTLANQMKPSYSKLLLYKVVSLLDPSQRIVIIEIQRARENGLAVDFEGIVKRLANSYPSPPVIPKPLLSAIAAKRLADGATKLAYEQFLAEGRQSGKGLNLMQFAVAVDPSNENALFLKALLLGNLPLQEIVIEASNEVFFAYLKQVIQTTENETVRLLLHHLSLMNNPQDRTALVSLQKAKISGKDIGFQALIDALNRQTYAKSSSSGFLSDANPNNAPSKPNLNDRLKNAQLRDTLVKRKWTLHNLQTKQEWFFEFRPIGKATDSRGTCKGRRGGFTHNWKKWEIRNSILTIDGYQKFKYDDRIRQWIQANGQKTMYLR